MDPAQWTPIDLAGELLVAPKRYICRLIGAPKNVGYVITWQGGDLGWVAQNSIVFPILIDSWPWGFALTETVLPATGAP